MRRLLAILVASVVLLGLAAGAGAFGVVPTPHPLPESSVESNLVFMGGEPGNQVYRYDFTVRNVSIWPAIQTVLIFFDSDPVTGEFLGDRSDFVEIQSPTNWEGYVWEDPDPTPWFVEWQTFSGPDRIFRGQEKAGFSVTFVWKDPTSTPGRRFFEAMNGVVYEGQTIIVGVIDESGSICGTVFDNCEIADPYPVTVDLLDSDGVFVGTTDTDDAGGFCFMELLPGDYFVSVVTPLSFVVDEELQTAVVNASQTSQADFDMGCLNIVPSTRTIGYWKHQANSLVMGKGKSQEGLDNMLAYMHEIRVHFNEHVYNPVIVYEVDVAEGATYADSLLALRQILTVNKGGTMLDRAKQQMLAMLLNVASLKISQAEAISEDGANVSQAITFCNEIITDQLPDVSYEVAKDVAEAVNTGSTVPAGVIPLETEIIWYARGSHDLAQIMVLNPNPFSSTVSIRYMVPEEGAVRDASLEVFDIRGRMIYGARKIATAPGDHHVFWDGTDNFGRKVASGTYFVSIRSTGGISSRKVMLIRSQ